MNERTFVVVCTTRGDAFSGVGSLFGPHGLRPIHCADPIELADNLKSGGVQLVLLDTLDESLEFDGFLSAITESGAGRFVPVLLLGKGEREQRARQRLGASIAVRSLDLQSIREPLPANGGGSGASLRRHARVTVRLPVTLTADGVRLSGHSHDLSEEGVGVIIPPDGPAGMPSISRVRVSFALPGGELTVGVAAEVRRVVALAGGGNFLGLWFPEVDADTRAAIRAFVARSQGRTAN